MKGKIVLAALAVTVAGCEAPTSTKAENVAAAVEAEAAELEASADNLEAAADAAMADADKALSGSSASGWSYQEKKDEMRGSTSKWATVDATAPIRLDFPYGESTPTLTVRYMKQYGTDIMISLNGQITCRGYNDDTVSVKFDNGPIKRWSCLHSDDGDSSTAFISPAKPFIAAIKKAKRVTIEAPVYQAGNVQMTFDVAGLKWE